MYPFPLAKGPRAARPLLAGMALLMAAFGALVSALPLHLVQPVISLGLGSFNLIALLLMIRRSREPGPEQKGWRLLTLSLFGVMAANAALFFTPSPLTRLSPSETLFFGLQLVLSILQGWAILSWPFRSTAYRSHQAMSLLGSLLFASSLFLLLWILALRQELDHGVWPIYIRMLGLAIRGAVIGGVATYILAEDPRRARGPMGWIFGAAVVVVAIIVLTRPYLYDQNAAMRPSSLFGMVLGAPICFGLATWLGAPVEVPEDQPRLRFPMVEGLIYLPFIGVGGVLILTAVREPNHLLTPLIGFMAVSALLLIRQFMLLREVRRSNERLEERVLARTHSLEELQGIMLRTERLNSIGALGAGLAHDLNNALAGVRAHAELAQMRAEEGQPPSASDLEKILVAADQSAALTSRLMAFARQEEEVRGPLDLVEEVSNQETILRMMLTRTISLTMDLEAWPTPIFGSRSHLEQILVNLVGNARDALPGGGNITVSVRTEPSSNPPSACLEVSDTGEGMTPEVQARIFQPFFTTKPRGKGTGLGLASVKQLVEEAHGTILVESKPGQGTRFALRFPLLA